MQYRSLLGSIQFVTVMVWLLEVAAANGEFDCAGDETSNPHKMPRMNNDIFIKFPRC